MQVIFTVLKVVFQGPFFPQLESILVVQRLLNHPKAMAELEQPWQDMPVCSIAQSCLPLCQPVDCSPPGSSVPGISQARILECVAIVLLQGIFPTEGSNLGLPHCRQILYHLSQQGSAISSISSVQSLSRF